MAEQDGVDMVGPQADTAFTKLNELSGKDEIPDLDPEAWLGKDQEMLGSVVVDGVRLKIAALTEAETQTLLKQARRPDPRNPKGAPVDDPGLFRLLMIAMSLNKANGTSLTPDSLKGRKSGSLTRIQQAILDLGGIGNDEDLGLPFDS